MKKFLVLTIFILNLNVFAQMLSMEERYKILFDTFKEKKYQSELMSYLSRAFQNPEMTSEFSKILENSFQDKILKNKLKIMFIKIIYDDNNSLLIGKAFKKLVKTDDEFRKNIIKIIKTEKNNKKIFLLFKKYFSDKLDENFYFLYKRYLKDKFLCQYNINLFTEVFFKNLFKEQNYSYIAENFNVENKSFLKFKERLKQELLSLPYDYKIKSRFDDIYGDILKKISDYLIDKNKKFFYSDFLESVFLETIYSVLDDDIFLNLYSKEFENDFLKDEKKLEIFLKAVLIDKNDKLFDKIKKKRFNCFHLNEKMFKINSDFLYLYLKDMLNKEQTGDIFDILFKSLK